MKKHIIPFVLFLAIFLSLPVYAAGGRLTAAEVGGKVGEQVQVAVRLENPGIVATRIFVNYDSQILTLDKAENGEVFAKNLAVFGKELSADPYVMLWDDSLSTSDNTKNGTLAVLTFTVKRGTPDGKSNIRISVDKASTFDTNLNEVTVADCTCVVNVPADGKPAQTTTGKPAQTTTAKPAQTTTIKSAQSTTAKPAQSTTAKPAQSTTAKPAQLTTTKPAQITTAKPAQLTTAKPAQITTAKPAQLTTDKPVQTAADLSGTAAVTTEPGGTTTTTRTAETSAVTVPETAAGTRADAEAEDTAAEVQTDPAIPEPPSESIPPDTLTGLQTPEPSTSERNLKPLWLLLLIPVGVAAFVLVKKKKA